MENRKKKEILKRLTGILDPTSTIPSCLMTPSLPDEWVPAKEYFVRRNEILGILSYGVSKKKKIHKVNFWNSSVNHYVSAQAKMEKIPDIQIQEEISYLENTLIDFLFLISDGTHGWNVGAGVIKILRNHRIYSIFSRENGFAFSEQSGSRNHLEIEIRTIMDFILKKGKLKTIEINEKMKEYILKEIPILPKGLVNKQINEPIDIKETMLDFLIDSGLEFNRAKGKEKEILEEVNYGLLNAFQSFDLKKSEIEFLTEEKWEIILRNHSEFLKNLPDSPSLKWERVGYSNDSEIQYLSKKYPNYQLQGKLVGFELKEFFLEKVSLRVMNISRSFFFDSKFSEVDFSNSISVFSRWKNNSLENCKFITVDFSESEMVEWTCKDTDFTGADFESVIFENCSFYLCDFSNAKFKKAIFYKCKFFDCKFKKSRFIEAILYLSEFKNSDIQKAINKNSEFNECSFS